MTFDEELLYRLVGGRIRGARQQLHPPLTQGELAKKLGISRASIVNIEAGRQRPPLHVLWQIASALNTEIALLLPSQGEYTEQKEPIQLDDGFVAQIEAAAEGDPTTHRLLTEFVGRARGR